MNLILPNFSIIVAIASDMAIGRDNQLLWHLSADLKRFKAITLGKAVAMGRRTYFSLPIRPLPGRRNLVLSDNPEEQIPGCEMFQSIPSLIAACRDEAEVFVMGGAMVYSQFLPLVSQLYITRVDSSYPDADVWFPTIPELEWKMLEDQEQPPDSATGLTYRYQRFVRV